jgi:hypothetical protein
MDENKLEPAGPEMTTPPPAEGSLPEHKKSRKLILWCALIGAVIALILSPIPGISWPFLAALEIFMFLRLVTYYGYKLSFGYVLLLILALVAISAFLTLVFGFVLGSLAWLIGLGWLVKMVVAGLVVWGLGEAAIHILDRIASSAKPV